VSRTIIVVLVVAAVLVLALSVPALAGASAPPDAWGQHRAEVNSLLQGGEAVEIDGDLVNNWGRDLLRDVKALTEELGLKNWAAAVGVLKMMFSE
jgi:hypothetical protein